MTKDEEITFLQNHLNKIAEISVKYYTTYGVPKWILRQTVSEMFGEHIAQIIFGDKW